MSKAILPALPCRGGVGRSAVRTLPAGPDRAEADHFKCYVDTALPPRRRGGGGTSSCPRGEPSMPTYRPVRPVAGREDRTAKRPATSARISRFHDRDPGPAAESKVVVATSSARIPSLTVLHGADAKNQQRAGQPRPLECYGHRRAPARKVNLGDQFRRGDRSFRPASLRSLQPREKTHGDIVTPIRNPEGTCLLHDEPGSSPARPSSGTSSARGARHQAGDILCVPSQKLKVTITP
jgi:hypothetical protein